MADMRTVASPRYPVHRPRNILSEQNLNDIWFRGLYSEYRREAALRMPAKYRPHIGDISLLLRSHHRRNSIIKSPKNHANVPYTRTVAA
jgi:hypothetical protein